MEMFNKLTSSGSYADWLQLLSSSGSESEEEEEERLRLSRNLSSSLDSQFSFSSGRDATQVKWFVLSSSVSDPDSFFTDPEPGFSPQSGSRIRIQAKNKFSKAN